MSIAGWCPGGCAGSLAEGVEKLDSSYDLQDAPGNLIGQI